MPWQKSEKISYVQLLDRVPDGSALIFADSRILFLRNVGKAAGSLSAKKQA